MTASTCAMHLPLALVPFMMPVRIRWGSICPRFCERPAQTHRAECSRHKYSKRMHGHVGLEVPTTMTQNAWTDTLGLEAPATSTRNACTDTSELEVPTTSTQNAWTDTSGLEAPTTVTQNACTDTSGLEAPFTMLEASMDTVGSPTLDASFMSPPPIARHSASRYSSFVSSPSNIVAELSRLAGMASIPPDQEIAPKLEILSVLKEWVARKNSMKGICLDSDAQASSGLQRTGKSLPLQSPRAAARKCVACVRSYSHHELSPFLFLTKRR